MSEIADPKAWRDFTSRVPRLWKNFEDGRKQVKPTGMTVHEFVYETPEMQVVKCSSCVDGTVYQPDGPPRDCMNCGGAGEVTLPVGPGVIGQQIVIERADFTMSAMVGGEHVGKRFVYRRGCVAPDNRSGGVRIEETT